MRSARFLEHKLHLQRYVALPRAGELLRHVAAQHGISPQAILDQLDTFPELEFYIPDAAQRVTWTATESVYVYALTRDDSSTPSFVTAFDPEGRAKRASAFEEPDCTPFGRRSGMGDAVPMSSGHDATYLAQILVTKDYDPWRGSMEIEVHVEQPDGSLDCYRFEGVDEDEVTTLNTHVSHELAADTVV